MSRYFDGSGYLDFGDAPQQQFTGQDVTISIWAKIPTGAPTGALFGKWGISENNHEFVLLYDAGAFHFWTMSTGTSFYSQASTGAISADRWYHVCGRQISGIGGYIFLDGVQVGSYGSTRAWTDTNNSLLMGVQNAGANPFTGTLAHGTLWNYPLPDHQIRLLSQGVNPLNLGYERYLRGYWPLDDYPQARELSGHGVCGAMANNVRYSTDEPFPSAPVPANSNAAMLAPLNLVPSWTGVQYPMMVIGTV